jgi:hypothetical protein
VIANRTTIKAPILHPSVLLCTGNVDIIYSVLVNIQIKRSLSRI